jgi:hypothetical protein
LTEHHKHSIPCLLEHASENTRGFGFRVSEFGRGCGVSRLGLGRRVEGMGSLDKGIREEVSGNPENPKP